MNENFKTLNILFDYTIQKFHLACFYPLKNFHENYLSLQKQLVFQFNYLSAKFSKVTLGLHNDDKFVYIRGHGKTQTTFKATHGKLILNPKT